MYTQWQEHVGEEYLVVTRVKKDKRVKFYREGEDTAGCGYVGKACPHTSTQLRLNLHKSVN